MELFKLYGTIGINNSEATKKIKETTTQAQKAAQNISKGFNSVGDVFKGIGTTFSKIGTTLSATITAPVVGLGVATANTAINFLSLKESASTAFKVLLGSGEAAQKMLDDLYTFAKTTPFSYDTYLTAGKTLVAMGVAAEDCIPYLDGITNAAIATGTGQEGVNSLSQALGRMQSSGKVTLETLNVLTYSGIPAIKILANEYGVTTEEMYKMISNSEILADEALPKLIQGMNEGTDGAAGATAAYGGLAKEMKGNLSGALDSLRSKFRNMSIEIWDAEEAYPELIKVIQDFTSSLDVLPKIFESVSKAAVPVLKTLSDKLKELKEYLDGLSPEQLQQIGNIILGLAAAGPTLVIVGKAFGTIGGALKGFSSVFSLFGKINLGGIVTDLSKFSSVLFDLLNPMKVFSSISSGLQSSIGFLAMKINTLASAFTLSGGGLKGALLIAKSCLAGVGSAFSSLMAAMAPVAAAIAVIIGVIVVLKENWDKVVQTFQNFMANTGLSEKFNQIKESASKLWEKIKGLKDLFVVIGTTVIALLQPAIAVIAGLFNGIVSAIDPLMTAIGGLVDILAGLGSLIVGIFTGDMTKVQESLGKIWQGICDLFGGLWDAVKSYLQGFWDGFIGWFQSLFQALGIDTWFSNLVTSISTWLNNIWTSITTWFSGIVSWLGGIWDAICNVIKIGFDLIGSIINAAFQIITLPFRFIWENCKDTIISVWNSIKSTVSNAINAVKNTITNVWNNIKAVTSNIWNGIKSVLTNVWNGIKNFVAPIFNAIKTTISNVWNNIKSVTSSVWNSIKSVTSSVWNGIKSAVSNVVNGIKSAVSNAFNAIKSTVSNIWNGIKSAIEKPINSARDIVKNAIDKIKGFFNFKFTWPKLKMPHFGISPSGWKIGDLLQGSIPKLSIDWYAKAMDDGMVLNDPTIFGLSKSGTLLGGGEAGSETVVGTESLMNMIQNATNNSNSYLVEILEKILMYLQSAMPELSNRQLVLDTGVLAGALTPEINKNLGTITASMARGRSY